ncbi:MAG: Gldg family protein [Polyangiales bacterium]
MATQKRPNLAASSVSILVLVAGALIALNVIAGYTNVGRIDLTANRLWSLSDGSRDLVSDLGDRMEITAYFTENLPPPFNSTEQYVRDILDEYSAASGGKVVVRFVNPDEDEEREAAEADGIQRVAHQKIENDAVSVVEGYRGLVIRYLGETKTIPVIQDPTGLEYTITMAIKELVGEKTTVGILSGHEGPTLAEGLSALRESLPTYELEEVSATSPIDASRIKALLIVTPGNEISEAELRNIDQYVMNGGSLGIFGGGLSLDIQSQEPAATTVSSGLNAMLSRWGVELRSDVALDFQCSRAPMAGPMGMQVAVPYPPVAILTFDEAAMEHPALFRIPTAVWPFSSTLALTTAPEGVNVEVLGRTSENSWRDTAPSVQLRPRHPREWRPNGDLGPFPVLAAISGELPSAFAGGQSSSENAGRTSSEGDVRVLVSGTGAFLRDEFIPQAGPDGQRQLSGGLAFALNAIDWLAADDDLIAIRAKNVEDPALEIPAAVSQAEDAALEAEEQAMGAAQEGDQAGTENAIAEREAALEERKEALKAWDSRKSRYRWLNTLGIPFALGLFGVLRWRARNARRKNMKL